MALSKEDLEYHISDRGLAWTLKTFKMTEKQAETIICGKVFGESDRFVFIIKKPPEPLEMPKSDGAVEMYRVIQKYYAKIKKQWVRDKFTVNSRSETQDDVFHDSLLSILKNSFAFLYVDDQNTLNFINRAIRKDCDDNLILVELAKEKSAEFKLIIYARDNGELQGNSKYSEEGKFD